MSLGASLDHPLLNQPVRTLRRVMTVFHAHPVGVGTQGTVSHVLSLSPAVFMVQFSADGPYQRAADVGITDLEPVAC